VRSFAGAAHVCASGPGEKIIRGVVAQVSYSLEIGGAAISIFKLCWPASRTAKRTAPLLKQTQ